MRDTYRPPGALVDVTAHTSLVGSPDGTLLASPGDTITCPDGHPVYRVAVPIVSGLSPKSEWVRCLDTNEPPASGVVPPCPECGRAVFPAIGGSQKYALFIDGRLVGADKV